MAQRVTGDDYFEIDGQLSEIKRQLRQPSGYPFDLAALRNHLQEGIEGRFVRRASLLLEQIGSIVVSAVKKFSARKSFVVDTSASAAVKISYLSHNFLEWFGEKVEMGVSGESLRYAKLLKSSLDAPILRELSDTAEVKLAQIFALMMLQQDGKSGALLVDGRANIFYVCDSNGTLHAVCIFWGDGGWFVYARSVAVPGEWGGGKRVFSRNSSDTVIV